MRLVEHSGFDELNLEIDGTKFSLRRGAPAGTAIGAAPVTAVAPPAASIACAAPAAAPARIRSHGTWICPRRCWARSIGRRSPVRRPLWRSGAPVEADTIVGIIEVMKLMNTVRAGVRGTVAEILAADGALVEYGEVAAARSQDRLMPLPCAAS